jgi:hypothetical protein
MEKISVSDLSIGDWVCAEVSCGVHIEPRLTPPMKVVGLGESWVNLEIDPEQGDPFEYEPHEIRGVPITVEVLEKNGLEYEDDGNDAVIFLCCDMFWARLCVGDTFWLVGIHSEDRLDAVVCDVKHIHELQHALRLASVGKEIVL